MKRSLVIGLLFLAMGLVARTALASTFSLAEIAFKSSADGILYDDPYLSWPPPTADLSGFNAGTGLGTIKYTFSGAGSHWLVGFFDAQFVDAFLSNGIDNEHGVVHGAPAAGQSWEIDDPGFNGGDIFLHLGLFDDLNPLPNTNDLPASSPGDVSVALGYAVVLGASDPSVDVLFRVALAAPSSGLYLEHVDALSGDRVFFSAAPAGSADPRGGGPSEVPEPATVGLVGVGLGLATAARWLRRRA